MVPVAQSRPCCAKAQIPGLEQTCDARPISKKVEDWCHLAGVKMMHLHGKKCKRRGNFEAEHHPPLGFYISGLLLQELAKYTNQVIPREFRTASQATEAARSYWPSCECGRTSRRHMLEMCQDNEEYVVDIP
jgi:hypothetical protein